MRRVAVVAFALVAACVPPPEDPISYGVLCQPATEDCPSVTTLEREVVGRNQVDYVVRNMGSALTTAEVVALVPGADFSAAEIEPDDLIVRSEHDAISTDVPAENRLTATDLGVRDSFQLGVRCSGCDVELEFVYTTVPRECFEEDDCPANWQCDLTAGRCVECLSNADCNSDQRCSLETGRCDPPDTSKGCATATPGSGPALLMVLAVVLLAARRRRFDVAAAMFIALVPISADASPPRASIAVAGGPRVMAGKLGPLTKRGVGLALQQELRWRYLGAGISLGTSYFLTKQEPPPFSRSLQTYGVSIGPRFYLPISVFELVAGGDYRRLGTANNSLVRVTGDRRSFDAIGGLVGWRVRWSGLEVRLEATGHHIIQLETTQFGLDLGVGFTNSQ